MFYEKKADNNRQFSSVFDPVGTLHEPVGQVILSTSESLEEPIRADHRQLFVGGRLSHPGAHDLFCFSNGGWRIGGIIIQMRNGPLVGRIDLVALDIVDHGETIM
jgi:hypothetical protein